jgi:deoxyribose-phosphate aldolase
MSDNVSILPAAAAARRNPGMEFEADWLEQVRVNTSAVERRAANIPARRTVKKEWQAAWLLKALSCIDLTTLAGDDTPGRARRLCAKARQPVRREILDALGAEGLGIQVGAVCVYHAMIAEGREVLRHAVAVKNIWAPYGE